MCKLPGSCPNQHAVFGVLHHTASNRQRSGEAVQDGGEGWGGEGRGEVRRGGEWWGGDSGEG